MTHVDISRLPFTFSFPLTKFYEKRECGEYRNAFIYAMDFFETSVAWLSLYFIKRLVDEGYRDKVLTKITEIIDTKRPLSFGDWLNSIFIPLYLHLGTKLPENPIVGSIVTNLFVKKSCILNGGKNNPGVVQLRNEYKGHGTTLAESIYAEILDLIYPRLEAMINALRPLLDCNSYSDGEGHVFIEFDGTTTDLYPLFFSTEEGYIYLFHTLKEEYVSYVSMHEKAKTLTTTEKNAEFDKFFQKIVPTFDIARDLNWLQVTQLLGDESRRILDRAYREKKYNRELFVDRRQLSDSFEKFKQSEDKTIFPLLGEAGQGKTNQLCFWVERLLETGECVLFLQSADFSFVNVETHLKSCLRQSHRKDVIKVISGLNQQALANGKKIYIILDAVNECLFYAGNQEVEGPLALYGDVMKVFDPASFANIKILFTCRNYTWKNLLLRESENQAQYIFRPDDEDTYALQGFTAEELSEAYEVYRDLYQMATDFEALTPSANIRLRDPLVLKIACTNFLGSALPEDTLNFTTISLFNRMLNDIGGGYAGKKQIEILNLFASYLLDGYESGIPTDSVSVSQLKEAFDDPKAKLHRLSRLMYNKDGITVAFGELLNKSERPVLRIVENSTTGDKRIQFIYERFLEYMMAREFVIRKGLTNNRGVTDVFVRQLTGSAINVVYLGALRNALLIEIQRGCSFGTLMELVLTHGDNPQVMLLVNEVCNAMISENYETDIFTFIDSLLSYHSGQEERAVAELNALKKKVEANEADSDTMKNLRTLQSRLEPTIRLRKLAIVNTVNGLFLTDYFDLNLYTRDPYELLWRLMNDRIREVGSDTCMYVYYLSNRTHTLGGNRLESSLTETIVKKMYEQICKRSIAGTIMHGKARRRFLVMTEAAVRLSFLLIVDTYMSGVPDRGERVGKLFEDIQRLFSHFTFNGKLVKLVMPVVRMVLRRQIMFQSDYVNNAIEYQGYWHEHVVPRYSSEESWSREKMRSLLPLINYGTDSEESRTDKKEVLMQLEDALHNAYKTADSFSYFVLERIMVIVGKSDFEWLFPILRHLFSKEFREEAAFYDYSQMSLLYSLYQIGLHNEFNRELIEVYSQQAVEWTLRCRGYFKARFSHKANNKGLYKRNVMSWYAAVYCQHAGDAGKLQGDDRCVPAFYYLVDKALEDTDRELLMHLLENVSEIVTDWGYIDTALQLVLYLMDKLDSAEKIALIDGDVPAGEGIVAKIGNFLSTAKNYFPQKVDNFLRQETLDLKFPGVSGYKEDILTYTPSGETISDLLTHKFGNFLMRSLLTERAFSEFAIKVVEQSVDKKNCFEWYDTAMKIVFNTLFGVKFRSLGQ